MSEDKVVENPTYMEHIRNFFADVDIEHMGQLGIDLSTYDGVKAKATSIYFQTQPPDAKMPPPPAPPWSQARSDTFRNWIVDGCPRGAAAPSPEGEEDEPSADGETRTRKDVRRLDKDEVKLLEKAFKGLMKRDPDDERSYFALAALHWLPAPTYCLHHENRYNPWHRVYLRRFEDGLRSVKGCENVTLPYWDVTGPFPSLLGKAPFASYRLPREIGGGFEKGYETIRLPAATIRKNLAARGVAGKIMTALSQSVWEKFDAQISGAHDDGHLSCGPTLSDQDVAAYDPLFWFFHANWDRLWWKWQTAVQATTLAKFRSTLSGPADWLAPPFNGLPPFEPTAEQTIDPGGVAYVHPPKEDTPVMMAEHFGNVDAARRFRVARPRRVSVRVKGIDRLSIPGSFTVHLRAGGKTVAQQGFFQSSQPRGCSNCREHGVVNVDFLLDFPEIRDRELSVGIELAREDRIGQWFPLSACGSPTINVRFPLEEG